MCGIQNGADDDDASSVISVLIATSQDVLSSHSLAGRQMSDWI